MGNLNNIITGYLPTSQTFLSDASGTILDPTVLNNVKNVNTAMTGGTLSYIDSFLRNSQLTLDIGPALNLVDCALNLEDRLISKAQEKITEALLSNDSASAIVSAVTTASSYIDTIKSVVDVIKNVRPKDLATQLAIAKGLQGISRIQKINEILDTFGSTVNNLADLISSLDTLDICSVPNYYSDGTQTGNQLYVPATAPFRSNPILTSASLDPEQIRVKDEYDSVMFDIKNHTGKDPSILSDEDGYSSMITSVNTVIISYHDKIIKSNSDTDDARFFNEFSQSIEIEKKNNSSRWSDSIKEEFQTRCAQGGRVIQVNANAIRAYGMRNSTNNYAGSLISTGVTTYSGPQSDFTTFLDIKPEQRPAELTRYWTSRGYNIPTGNTYTNSAGKTFKIGTLNYEDAFKGPFGDKLISDYSCASTRVPIGSVLALKNPDGTPYNPSGKNPSGLYTVSDTGNAELTYKKVDIFTTTPNLYSSSNMAAVQVFLVSRGTKEAPQYKRAQKMFRS